MNATCINLRKQFPEYKITLDPAAEDARDPWYFQIPGKRGTIYPYGGVWLAVEVDRHPSAVKVLDRLAAAQPSAVSCVQRGDGEYAFLFDSALLPTVARIVGSRMKRKVSSQMRAKLKANLEKARAKIRVSKSHRDKVSAS